MQRTVGSVVGLAAILWINAALVAQASSAPEEVLTAKGLTKVGATYVLESDARMPEALRVIRASKKKLEDNARKRGMLKAQIKDAQNTIAALDRQYGDLNARFNPNLSTRERNDIISATNALESRMREGKRYSDDKEKDLKGIIDPKDDYVAAVLDLSTRMEAAQKQYEALAADAEVTAAIARINDKAKPKVKLGPSEQFNTELKPLRKQRETIESSVITLGTKHGVPTVDVTLNGTVTEPMVLDSGASLVTLSPATAAKLGLKPSDKDPVLKLSLADGRVVEGRLMTLDSVRVGHFTVQDVECAILPAEVANADCLLGGSFLQNFVYRIDLTAGVLYMSSLGGKVTETTDRKGLTTPKSIATSLPSPTTLPAISGGAAEVDLLARVDVEQDAVSGIWTITAAGLESDVSDCARIRLPVKPPKEYDFIVEFTRVSGNDSVVQHVSAGGRAFMWVVSGGQGGAHGFEMVDGKTFDNNETTVRPGKIRNDRRIKSVIQVRERSITVLLNNKPIVTYKGSPASLSIADWWKIGPGALGVGCWKSKTVFHTIKVVDKTGAGQSPAGATTRPTR
ncbi:MAG: aspartyl protease family protein [Tepidisphaeraceae bacterium]